MSVDIIGPGDAITPYGRGAREGLTGREPRPIIDLIVIFGGWGGVGNGGAPLSPDVRPPTGTSALLRRVLQLSGSPGRRIRVLAYEGSLMFGNNEPLRILRSHFHPLGKVVLYGYSAGGRDAITFAWQIWQNLRYYAFSSQRFYTFLGADAFASNTIGVTRVDLLVTVDPAVGPGSRQMFRNIPPSVRRNVNTYQTHPSARETSGGMETGASSHGGPTTPLDRQATQVENRDVSHRYRATPGEAHGRIDNDTNEDSFELIRGVLGYESVPSSFPPGTAPA